MTVETNNDKIIMEDLVKTLDNICELYEKQEDLQECIRDARTLLNSISSEPTYIDTVLTDIQKCSIL
tara:strand:+ start:149 stop:349 length:201 start_codon:yes stop_codon:yes gene_type:complete